MGDDSTLQNPLLSKLQQSAECGALMNVIDIDIDWSIDGKSVGCRNDTPITLQDLNRLLRMRSITLYTLIGSTRVEDLEIANNGFQVVLISLGLIKATNITMIAFESDDFLSLMPGGPKVNLFIYQQTAS